MTNSYRYWQTGIPELDQLLFNGRGFRGGRGYIISGPPQSGKTILAMCFMKNMIAQGGAFTYITIGRPAKDLVELFQEFNIDINSYLEAMHLVILDWATARSGGDIRRAKRYLRQYLSERAVASIRFGVDPCSKQEFLHRITEIHEEKAAFHGKPGLAVIDAISDQVVLVSRKGLPGSIISDIYFTARQKFSMEEPGTAFHLFAPLEERVSRKYSQLLDDLHLSEDGTINLAIEYDEAGGIRTRSLWVRSLYGGKIPTKRLLFDITAEDLVRITGSESQPSPGERVRKKEGIERLTPKEGPKMSGGMHFHSNVTVKGSIVNIEGNQYNLREDPKEKVLVAINRILTAGLRGADVIPALNALETEVNTRGDLSREEIASSIQQDLVGELGDETAKGHLDNIYKQLAVGASGSLLASGIIQGIKLLLGIT